MKTKLNFGFKDDLSKEAVNNRLSNQQIYEFYLGKQIEFGKKIKSPFREDKHPSLSFIEISNGKILWRDWGNLTVMSSLDVFAFVQQLFNCSFVEALVHINRDFGLGLTTPMSSLMALPPKDSPIPKKREISNEKIEKKIEIEKRSFTSDDLKFWREFNIDPRTLAFYKVYAIKYAWLNGVLVRISTPSKPLYAYELYDWNTLEIKYKIYSPFAEKRSKWLTNASYNIIQGFDQLSYSEKKLIITKSLKDVMVLHILGYDAIAPQSEGSLIPESILKEISVYYPGSIYVFYDNDEAGMLASSAMCKKTTFRRMYIPLYHGAKDISDYIKEFGVIGAKILMDSLFENSTYIT